MKICRELTKPSAGLAAVNEATEKSRKRGLQGAVWSLINPFTAVFVIFLAVASVSLASLVNLFPKIAANAPFFFLALAGFLISAFFLCIMLRKYVLAYEGAVSKN